VIKKIAFLLLILILAQPLAIAAASCTLDSISPASINTGGTTEITASFTDFANEPSGDEEVTVDCGGGATKSNLSCDVGTDGICTVDCGIYDTEGDYTVQTLVLKDTGFIDCTGTAALSVTVNTVPYATAVSVTPDPATTSSSLTCNYTYNDDDNDLEGDSTFKWLEGDVEEPGEVDSTLDSSKTAKGEGWKCEVTPVAATGTSPGTAVQSDAVTIGNTVPVAVLSASTGATPINTAVTFTGSCSDIDGNAELSSCEIDFGDGNSGLEFTEPEMVHVFASADSFTITLTATDESTATDVDSVSVTVGTASAPTVGSKRPLDDVNVLRPTIGFDLNDSGSGINLSSLALFVDGNKVNASTTAFGDDYHASWQFDYDLGDGKTVEVGLSAEDDVGSSTGDVNWSFDVDRSAPVFDDITVEEYTDDTTPSISFESVSGSPSQLSLSCNGTSWKDWQAYDETVTNFSIVTGSYGCLDGEQGSVTIYARLRDAAGNLTGIENDSTTYDSQDPDAPSLDTANVSDNEVDLDWEAVSDNGPSGIKEYVIYRDGSEIDTTTDTSYTATDLTNGTEYAFKIKARDKAGNLSAYSNELEATPSEGDVADNSPPILLWELPSNNSTVTGIVTLKVQAYDDESNLRFVKFYVDDGPIDTDTTGIGERYAVEWDSASIADGTHTLRATAKTFSGDEENNSTVRTISVTTDNGVISVPDTDTDTGNEGEAQAAIDQADDAKEEGASLFERVQALGGIPGSAASKMLSDASNLLDEAQNLFDDKDYANAKLKAEAASEKIGELANIISVEDYGQEKEYVYNEEHLAVLLQGVGFNQQLAEEAKTEIEANYVNRKLLVKKLQDDNGVYYRATIAVKVKNESEEARDLKVVEVIPKELATSASEIVGEGFTVLVDDPVLQWEVSLEPGEERELVYALKESLEKEAADTMIESGVIDKFAVPPVIIGMETEVNAGNFSPMSDGIGMFGLQELAGAIGWIALLVIVVGTAALGINYYRQKQERPSSGLGSVSKESRSRRKTGFFNRLGGLGKKKEEDKKPKWAFRQ